MVVKIQNIENPQDQDPKNQKLPKKIHLNMKFKVLNMKKMKKMKKKMKKKLKEKMKKNMQMMIMNKPL